MSTPLTSGWYWAKKVTPRRAEPYTDDELQEIRERFAPANLNREHAPYDLTVIWTLLDMLEEQRGWKP